MRHGRWKLGGVWAVKTFTWVAGYYASWPHLPCHHRTFKHHENSLQGLVLSALKCHSFSICSVLQLPEIRWCDVSGLWPKLNVYTPDTRIFKTILLFAAFCSSNNCHIWQNLILDSVTFQCSNQKINLKCTLYYPITCSFSLKMQACP